MSKPGLGHGSSQRISFLPHHAALCSWKGHFSWWLVLILYFSGEPVVTLSNFIHSSLFRKLSLPCDLASRNFPACFVALIPGAQPLGHWAKRLGVSLEPPWQGTIFGEQCPWWNAHCSGQSGNDTGLTAAHKSIYFSLTEVNLKNLIEWSMD